MLTNQLSFIRKTIYQLKRRYGFPLDLYAIDFGNMKIDRGTGQKEVPKIKYHINRAIVIPNQLARKFAYDLAYLAGATQHFTYGAFFDEDQKTIIIDIKDLPKNLKLTQNNFIIYDHKRFQIKIIMEAEHKQAYMIIMTHAPGASPFEIHTLLTIQKFKPEQQAIGNLVIEVNLSFDSVNNIELEDELIPP